MERMEGEYQQKVDACTNRYPAVLNYYALMGVYHQAVRDCARMEPVGRIGWLNT